ncbi:ROK family protein [Nocardia seriolae]|nr:ROK family protein [Nocardia seriolae]MTJ74226.1 ROK family protein [Nocardia seriolae]MTJ91214.1 ROK family protein [Nocardia seriolae]MTK35179.1 ROK family protein [Nocardia seriolae]MTK39372.1 ROK family protein [Nocardia seriolae]
MRGEADQQRNTLVRTGFQDLAAGRRDERAVRERGQAEQARRRAVRAGRAQLVLHVPESHFAHVPQRGGGGGQAVPLGEQLRHGRRGGPVVRLGDRAGLRNARAEHSFRGRGVHRRPHRAATGLAHGSVTALVSDLTDRGLIREDDALRSGTRGRPLRLIPDRACVAAIQITSEHLRVAVADLAGEVVWRETIPHQLAPCWPEVMADAIAAAITSIGAADATRCRAVLARVVVAMAGPVQEDAYQTVTVAPDFGWMRPVRLRDLIAERRSGPPVAIDVVNDANAAALAEFHALKRDSRGLVLIEAGTGIGGGVVLDGRIHTGSHGITGEPGHVPVAMDGPDCVCGARGCLVAYAGPEAVFTASGLADLLHDKGLHTAQTELLARLHRADPRATAALEQAARALSAAILSITALLDADQVVLGGLLGDWTPWLAPTIEDRLSGRRALAPGLALRITPATLGDDAILLGALGFARRAILSDPSAIGPER